ncbi:MAG: radical SAM protein [Chloroflexi bacterium]|nr:radical SAM protein [Chloroflexota bacterium]
MRLNSACHAAWYELNISSADDCVSACCYYSGEKDPWLDEPMPLDHYWNSDRMKAIRRLNSPNGGDLSGGCASCYFFDHRGEAELYYPRFLNEEPDWSPAQAENWKLAVEDYQAGREKTRATPMRFYVNFGFACNLSCVMCHQVPRRGTLRRQVSAESVLAWREELKRAIDITVIGGEPFVLVEALKFMRAIIEDPEFESVHLTICTNGTLHHKFMDLLRKKKNLHLVVSLDSMGEEYEAIRLGASWNAVAENIASFIETGRELGFPWHVQSPCMVLATNIPRLEDYARWCLDHGIRPSFYDFIDARGIEATFERENVIAHPELLLGISDWAGHFERAIAVLQPSRFSSGAVQLENLYARASTNLAVYLSRRDDVSGVLESSTWTSVLDLRAAQLAGELERNFYDANGQLEWRAEESALLMESGTLNDHVATRFVDIGAAEPQWLRVACEWPAHAKAPQARSYVQDDAFQTVAEADRALDGCVEQRVFRVEATSKSVRIVFTGTPGAEVVLPTRISIARPASSGALIGLDSIVEMAPARPKY